MSGTLERRRFLRFFGCGALGALSTHLPWASFPRVRTWLSDRGANELVGLDAQLIVQRRIGLPHPTELEVRPGGGLWALSASDGIPFGPHELFALDSNGEVEARASFGTCLGLSVGSQGEAYVLEWHDQDHRVWRVPSTAEPRVVFQAQGLTSIRWAHGRLHVGAATGEYWALEPKGNAFAPAALGSFAGEVTDLAPGPEAKTTWALFGAGDLALLDERGQALWQCTTGLQAQHLIPVPGQERVWLADTSEPLVRRFGSGGQLELSVGDLPQAGGDRGWASADELLLVLPGALLVLDHQGALQPGQGGFEFLVDVARTG